MSQFDFPRLNFHGRLIMDVGTANNAYYHPLLIFDPLHSQPVFPPAIQLTPEQAKEFTELGIIPHGSLDEKTMRVIILPVDSDDLFMRWAITPLGESPTDTEYYALYDNVERLNEPGTPLKGAVPAYWNYYGDMGYAYEGVTVTGVTAFEHGRSSTYTADNKDGCPEDLAPMLGAELTLRSVPNDKDSNTGIMCDVNAEGTSVTQLFCDCVTLFKGKKTFFRGKPGKATTRMMSFPKVVNADPGPEQGAAQFFWTIPIDALRKHDALLAAFQKYYQGKGKIAGLMIRQLIHQVFEVRNPDYHEIEKTRNPALSMITGSITPWIEGDMRTFSTGRLMHPVGPLFQVLIPGDKPSSKPGQISPIVLRIQPDEKIVSLDVLNSFPEVITVEPVRRCTTAKSTPPVCEMADLGDFELRSQVGDKKWAIAKIGQAMYSTDAIIASGGMLDLPFDSELAGDDPSLTTFQLFSDRLMRHVSLETPYFVASDQGGIYADQGDIPDLFMNDGLPLEPCRLIIHKNGAPLTTPEPFYIQQLVMTAGAPHVAPYLNPEYPYQKRPLNLENGTELLYVFDTSKPGSFVYVLIPPGQPLIQNAGEFNPILQSYVTVRILSDNDKIEASLDNPPTWETVYNRVFRLYTLIYPAMSAYLEFKKDICSDKATAGQIIDWIDLKLWASSNYMPRTRDLSRWQRNLFKAWALQNGVDVSLEGLADVHERITLRK